MAFKKSKSAVGESSGIESSAVDASVDKAVGSEGQGDTGVAGSVEGEVAGGSVQGGEPVGDEGVVSNGAASDGEGGQAGEPMDGAEGAAVDVEALQREILTLGEQVRSAEDRYLRLSAEFDNYRRRTQREKQALVEQAASRTIRDLLPVLDDFDRALLSSRESDDLSALLEGLELIRRNLDRFLSDCGVSEMSALGEALDTDYHEAVTVRKVEDPGQRGRVVEVVKKGYLLHGSVVRHAQVIVGE